MATKKHSTVLLLFAGGAALLDRGGVVRQVQKASDVTEWMGLVPELSLIATVKTVFLTGGGAFDVQPEWWQSIATTIAKRYRDVDGFVITQSIDAIPYTAAALSIMLAGIGKPVVITGAPELTLPSRATQRHLKKGGKELEIGIRANLVNAVQVATLDLGEVAVLFGNELLRAGTVLRHSEPSLNIFESAGIPPLGRVDFGLKLEPHRKHRSAVAPKVRTSLKPRVLQVPLVPSTASPVLPPLKRGAVDGLLITGIPVSAPQAVLDDLLQQADAFGVPLAVASRWPMKRSPRYLLITDTTPAMALVKFMWALGQTSDRARLQKLLESDIAGEKLHLHLPRR